MSRRLIAYLVGLALVALAVLALLMAWNSLWARFPWSAESRARRAEEAAAHSQLDASARSLEVTGERESAQRVDTYSHVLIETQAIASEGMAEARSAPDASTPLDPDRAARLRSVLGRLCDQSPRTCPTSPAGDAGSGDPPL